MTFAEEFRLDVSESEIAIFQQKNVGIKNSPFGKLKKGDDQTWSKLIKIEQN